MAFEGVDFLGLEDLLSDEERLVRDSVRSFVEDQVIPIIAVSYTHLTLPTKRIV